MTNVESHDRVPAPWVEAMAKVDGIYNSYAFGFITLAEYEARAHAAWAEARKQCRQSIVSVRVVSLDGVG